MATGHLEPLRSSIEMIMVPPIGRTEAPPRRLSSQSSGVRAADLNPHGYPRPPHAVDDHDHGEARYGSRVRAAQEPRERPFGEPRLRNGPRLLSGGERRALHRRAPASDRP